MAYCKICDCGNKIVFERPLSYPEKCPSCGRKLDRITTYNENDPRVERLMREHTEPQTGGEPEPAPREAVGRAVKRFALRLCSGKEIPIPKKGGIIGRTELGAEELAEFPSVSKQHMRVTVIRNIVLIEDISQFGTFVDGRRLNKNEPARVGCGAKITLCNVDAELVEKEESDQ